LAGETKPYRFLLRMSDELRRRLVDSAERSGKSLNREIVERLEASLSEHVVADREANGAMAARPRRPSQIGGVMTRRRRHGLAAFAVALVAAIATIAGLALSGSSASQAVAGDPEFPTALSQHLRSIPGNGGEPNEGPGSYEEQQFAALAYPAADIPQAALAGAKSAAAAKKGKFGTGKGQKGQWISVGPTEALYPATELRNSFSYVPNAYVAGGRTTVLAIAPTCKPGQCRLWAAAAGGGIWTTKNALNGQPSWDFVSGSFGIQAVSSITVDPNDPSGDTAWVGTGEANASGDSAAGVGVYKTTNGGATWTGPLGASVFNSRAVGSIAVVPGSPSTIYAASTRGVRGVSSVSGGGVSIIPGAPQWGLYKSTNGGASWTFIHNGAPTPGVCTGDTAEATNGTPCSPRGVRRVVLDPQNPSIVYAGSYARGVWKSTDAGATWTQIHAALVSSPTVTTARPEIAVNVKNGKTVMYIAEGASGSPTARVFRTDDAQTATPASGWSDLTSSSPADAKYGTFAYCTGQCWYDNFVYTPKGSPDVVYVGGSYSYNETGNISNGRAVVLSRDGGQTWNDMTMDGTDFLHPNGLHPDQHFLVTNPSNPLQFFESNDGGIMRSSGDYTDASQFCAPRGITGTTLARCQQLLSSVPTQLESLNKGYSTLQFQSLSVSPFNSNLLQGGTQDNGTWQTQGNPSKWENTMIGDGGQSGFDAKDPSFRFHTFFDAQPDVNFSGGAMADWNWIGDPFFIAPGVGEPRSFYIPIISDPVETGWMFAGLGHVWRTKTHGMGSMTLAEFRQHCNEWTGDFAVQCGDWEPLGTAGTAGFISGTAGVYATAAERAPSDSNTLWAAAQNGRVVISKNAGAEPASSVSFARLDDDTTAAPGRFVSSIFIDPADANHAWISYMGFDLSTPATPGHIFEVRYNAATGQSTWTNRSYNFGDLPANDVAYDAPSGDLYASTDFGVFRLESGTTTWTDAAPGMPNVEVAGLTYVGKDRILYAATHGLGAWRLNLG